MVGVFKNLPDNVIFIPGNVASSKNSKQWTGTKLISSRTARIYKENTAWYWKICKQRFDKMIEGMEAPYNIALFFIRDSRRRFDYINVAQILFDLMVDYSYLCDDSAIYLNPIFAGYAVDKEKSGVIIGVYDENKTISEIKIEMKGIFYDGVIIS